MKIYRAVILAGLLVGFAPSVFADCNPPCRGQKVCRYDSTRTPQFYCQRPVSGAAANQASAAVVTPSATRPVMNKNCQEFESIKGENSNPQCNTQPKKNASAQYNPKEVGVDKVRRQASKQPQ